MTEAQAAQLLNAVHVLVYAGECVLFLVSLWVGYVLGKGRS